MYICDSDRNVILFMPIMEIYWRAYKTNAVNVTPVGWGDWLPGY